MNQPTGGAILSLLRYIFITDWPHKLRLVLTAIILFQFAVWLDTYLLTTTEYLLRAAIVVGAVTEFFPRLSPIVRRMFALLLLVFIHFRKLELQPLLFERGSGLQANLLAIADSFAAALTATAPFIWFALGAYVLYLVSVFLLQDRTRIIVYTLLSVVIIALVDSYSKLILWDQAAFIIFSGLGLIVIEHSESFREKHPASWAYLAEYPGKVAVPIVLILSIVMAVGMTAPNARPLLQDPYTIYKHWKGEKVITGGKGFPNTTPSFVSTLDASSGYGRDDGDLGGGFNYDYTEVMRITTTHRSYWRGETKSLYTGSGWMASDADTGAPVETVMTSTALSEFDWGVPRGGHVVEVQQQVRMSGEEPSYDVLFGAAPLQRIQLERDRREFGEDGEMVTISPEPAILEAAVWSPRQSELRWRQEADYPTSYDLVSALPVTDEAAWRTVTAADYSDELWRPYLQLPDTVTGRVTDLAQEITADADTPYDKVKAVEAYLQENYIYTNKPDLSKGSSEDFVDRFLFEIQEGYCDYYSTAMAVMVRSLGLPARWVKGFKSGSQELEEMYLGMGMPQEILDQLESGEGNYIVRNADAHSWVEVFFPGYGWLPFEPTSGMSMPTFAGEQEAIPAVSSVFEEGQGNVDAESGGLQWLISPISAVVGGALVLIALVVFLLRTGMLRGRVKLGWLNRLFRGSADHSMNQQALHEFGRILKLFRRKGYERGSHETIRESFSRWAEGNMWLKKDLDLLVRIQEKAKYSPYSITSEDLSSIFTAKKRLKEEL